MPVAGRTAAVEKAGSARMSDPVQPKSDARGCSEPGDLFDKEIILDAARQPPPPGTRSTSHDSIAARSSRFEKVRRSAVTVHLPAKPPGHAGRVYATELVRTSEVELGHAVVHRPTTLIAVTSPVLLVDKLRPAITWPQGQTSL